MLRRKKNKLLDFILIIIGVILILFPKNYVQATIGEELDIRIAPKTENKNKIWKVKFNKNFKKDYFDKSEIADYIYIVDSLKQKHNIKLELDGEESDVILVNPLDSYEYDELYTLYIEKGLKNLENNMKLEKTVKMTFEIDNPKEVEGLDDTNLRKADNGNILYLYNNEKMLVTYKDITVEQIIESIDSDNNKDIITIVDKNMRTFDKSETMKDTMFLKVKRDNKYALYKIYIQPELKSLNKEIIKGIHKNEITVKSGVRIKDVIDSIETVSGDADISITDREFKNIEFNPFVQEYMYLKVYTNNNQYWYEIKIKNNTKIDLVSNNKDVIGTIVNKDNMLEIYENATIKSIKNSLVSDYSEDIIEIVDGDKNKIDDDKTINDSMLILINRGKEEVFYTVNIRPEIIITNKKVVTKFSEGSLHVAPERTVEEVISSVKTSNSEHILYISDRFDENTYDLKELVDGDMIFRVNLGYKVFGYPIRIMNPADKN